MGSAFMELSVVARNRAGFGGGGIANVQTGSFDIEDTTIHDNVAGTEGGGIANYDGAALTLTSVVFAGNVPNDCIGSRPARGQAGPATTASRTLDVPARGIPRSPSACR